LARLIYQDAPVMILDEPVASLDPEGERAVFELFAQMADDKVIVFTTHRYDSIPQGTTIVVLVDGRIAEIGTHEELVQRQRHYWSLWTSGRDQATRTRAVHNGRLRATAYTPLGDSGNSLSPPPLKSGDSSTSRDPEPGRPQHTWTGGGPPATGKDDHSGQRWDVYPGEERPPSAVSIAAGHPSGVSNSKIEPGRHHVR
jgi:hypothetical protein